MSIYFIIVTIALAQGVLAALVFVLCHCTIAKLIKYTE